MKIIDLINEYFVMANSQAEAYLNLYNDLGLDKPTVDMFIWVTNQVEKTDASV